MNPNIRKLKKIIDKSNNIVFFDGTGIIAESRKNQDKMIDKKYKQPLGKILSHTFFEENTEEFFEFYKEKMNYLNINPNIVHKKLFELEEMGKLKAIITQNIDGLYQKAGLKNVFEIQGSIYSNHCVKCNRTHTAKYVFEESRENIPLCQRKRCDGIVKPDIVLLEEFLDVKIISDVINIISSADTLIIEGSDLSNYPLNIFINYFRGDNLILVNKDAIQMDPRIDLLINESLENIFIEM